jgi:hypothetical protein
MKDRKSIMNVNSLKCLYLANYAGIQAVTLGTNSPCTRFPPSPRPARSIALSFAKQYPKIKYNS